MTARYMVTLASDMDMVGPPEYIAERLTNGRFRVGGFDRTYSVEDLRNFRKL
jgi:hypothetical protein